MVGGPAHVVAEQRMDAWDQLRDVAHIRGSYWIFVERNSPPPGGHRFPVGLGKVSVLPEFCVGIARGRDLECAPAGKGARQPLSATTNASGTCWTSPDAAAVWSRCRCGVKNSCPTIPQRPLTYGAKSPNARSRMAGISQTLAHL
ncbi:hypothetical protein J2S92_003896 [Arthrobacter bambusae]|nr:hypothetical protein [Arthrobacter bambusae]MDQ0237498.1 hypothetical protein [Arthrobacter bambusae]